jgi:ribosomal protein L37E
MNEKTTLQCFRCGSDDIIPPDPEFPDKDGQCNSCGAAFGPRWPGNVLENHAYIEECPPSKPFFAPHTLGHN